MRRFKYLLMISIIMMACLALAEGSGAEKWVARYNGVGQNWDETHSFAVDNIGNMYVTGYRDGSETGLDYTTIKFDAEGKQIWIASWNGDGNGDDRPNAIAVDKGGNVYVTGYSFSADTNSDYATIKYDPNGKQLWAVRYNGTGNSEDFAWVIAVDDSGNVYVGGYSICKNTGYDYATVKYDSNGKQKWVVRYNGKEDKQDGIRAIALDGSGNVYVSGVSFVTNMADIVTIKYDKNGKQKWLARYDDPIKSEDLVRTIMVDSDGNVYVAATTVGTSGSYDYTAIKYDSSGRQMWVGRYDGPKKREDIVYSMAVDGAGNVYVTGFSMGKDTGQDFATVKYDSNGSEKWVQRYDGPGHAVDGAYTIALDDGGNVYVAGRSFGGESGYDCTVIKYDGEGNQKWIGRYSGPGVSRDSATNMALDKAGGVYLVGDSRSSGAGYDFVIIKY